jgi:Tfp pilus assembly protein FimT
MNRYNKGFTIVELMLAMGFVSALLLAVAMTVIQIGNTYNRGITYKSVNTAGSALANELQRSINSSVAFEVAGSQSRFINETWGGRLCLGQYSYIWNYGSAIKSESSNLNKYSDSENVIRFIKVLDSSYGYCSEPGGMISSSGAVEILDVGQSDLAMHSFSISSNDSAYDSRTGQRLYYISFRVGTNDQDALSGTYDSTICKTVSEVNANPSFCAVNQFDIVARAGNISQ